MELPKELLEALDALVGGVKTLTERAEKEDAAKAEALAEAQRAADEADAPKAPSFAEIDAALTEAELPATARAAVLTAVEGGADLKEAVASKKAEVEALLSEAGAFRGAVNDEKSVSFVEAETEVVSNIYG